MTNKKNPDAQAQMDTAAAHLNNNQTKNPGTEFPIIGIGASAGGLEALELFLRNVPEKSGMAFIVIQHLDPTRKGMMAELLERITAMPVFQIEGNTSVQPDCIYLIPPNKDMSIYHGTLHLFEPAAPRGLRLPIDFFFRAMADDQQERSIGVILSGMGTDGTMGLKAIKEKEGMIFVQEPASAKFDGMPNSAIHTGLVDIVAPAEELPSRIISYLKHKPLIKGSGQGLADKDRSAFEKIAILLRSQTGNDFSLYKKTTIYRRIERRMGIHQITELATYIRFLQENPQELQVLFKELLIGVTKFFRDPEAWEQMKDQIIPEILSGYTSNQTLRAWVPACSTGEEAYSLAIVFKEALEHVNSAANYSLQIFATDLDRDAIAKARQGLYPANITADVTKERLQQYFIQEEDGYRIAKEIRDMVVFAPQNIIMDPPFTKLHILSCRNLLIYFVPEAQKKLLALFHQSLNPGGFLFLGGAETIGVLTDHFEPIPGKSRLYRRLESTDHADLLQFTSPGFRIRSDAADVAITHSKTQKHIPNLEVLANDVILQRYAPAAVLVSGKGDILYTSGRTGKYLEPTAGKANWNVFAMVPAGLHNKLSRSFERAIRQKSIETLRNVEIDTDGEKQITDVTIQPLKEPKTLQRLVMIVFKDVRVLTETESQGENSCKNANRGTIAELELELEQTRRELHAVRQEKKSSEEELLSAYEELQSTNEELQSTNEETITSQEELQSLNEELQTVNYELQAKLDELSQVNNDMKNLLESTEIAILFLDNALCVRRFTTEAAKIIKLIPGDVGRPITDIVSKLIYPEMEEDAREVLRTLAATEKNVTASDGSWFNVRIIPYRTLENKIDGLVLIFNDITDSKTLEISQLQTAATLEKHITDQDFALDKINKKLQNEIQKDDKERKLVKKKQKSDETTGGGHHEQER